jgi:signal transduction histidine kinase
MKPNDMKKLFKLFGKLKDRKNMNKNGTGLGLNICKRIVESMGGEIKAESKYGVGTTFSMTMVVGIKASMGDPQSSSTMNKSSTPIMFSRNLKIK